VERPAIVTDIAGDFVCLTVFLTPGDVTNQDSKVVYYPPGGCFRIAMAVESKGETFVVGTWRWPPRV
jgi:hypothetical protein